MNIVTEEKMKFTSADLELLPDNFNRYEIIDGELTMTRAPHWKHQTTIGRIYLALESWSIKTGKGRAVINPGLIFSDIDNVIPDLVWISKERLALSLDESGHLINAPELIVEVLSEGTENIRRDKEKKLKLYSNRGVQEYWIADWKMQSMEVYRRNQAKLELVKTLMIDDELTSPLLPDFSVLVNQIFA